MVSGHTIRFLLWERVNFCSWIFDFLLKSRDSSGHVRTWFGPSSDPKLYFYPSGSSPLCAQMFLDSALTKQSETLRPRVRTENYPDTICVSAYRSTGLCWMCRPAHVPRCHHPGEHQSGGIDRVTIYQKTHWLFSDANHKLFPKQKAWMNGDTKGALRTGDKEAYSITSVRLGAGSHETKCRRPVRD